MCIPLRALLLYLATYGRLPFSRHGTRRKPANVENRLQGRICSRRPTAAWRRCTVARDRPSTPRLRLALARRACRCLSYHIQASQSHRAVSRRMPIAKWPSEN